MVVCFKYFFWIAFFTTIFLSCKKNLPDEVTDENTLAQTDSVANILNYGAGCNQYLRDIDGAILHSFTTREGNYVFCGHTINIAGFTNIYLLKTNCFGETEIEKVLKRLTNSEGLLITEIGLENYLLLTKSESEIGTNKYVLNYSKLNSELEEEWTVQYSDMVNMDFRCIEPIQEDIVALVSDYNTNNTEGTLVRFDANGNIILKQKIKTKGQVHHIMPIANDQYLTIGQFDNQPMLTKLNSQGDSVWTKTLPMIGQAAGFQILKTPNDDLIITGATTDMSFYYDRALFCIRINTSGTAIWSEIYDNNGFINFKDVAILDDGNMVLNVEKQVQEEIESTLVKINISDGSVIWERNAGTLLANTITGTDDNGMLYIGNDISIRSSIIRKTDANGF